jgi:hypothetical protein
VQTNQVAEGQDEQLQREQVQQEPLHVAVVLVQEVADEQAAGEKEQCVPDEFAESEGLVHEQVQNVESIKLRIPKH